MNPSWALFCAVLPLLVSCSGPDYFTLNESSFRVSPVLESLQCYNDYQSKVDCQWREDLSNKKNMTLELWNWNPYEKRDSPRRTTRCEPLDGPPGPHDDVKNLTLMRCRFNTSLFAIAINHTFFFKTLTATSCFSSHRSLILSQQLRVHPPVDLSVNISEKGDRLIQWSSPYPASSRLSHNLTYQLNYRIEGQDSWKSETLNETHLELWNEHLDLPVHQRGCWYEARVRAKVVTRGLWSEWSPLVTWKTPEAKDQTPSMQCVLDGEEKVTCSWEVMKEKAQFITYHVECQHKHQNTIAKRCCVHKEVTRINRHNEALLRYSCSLTSSYLEHLKLELIPELNAKSFNASQNIIPNPPVAVKVTEEGRYWKVEWKKPTSVPVLSHEVRYWNPLNKKNPQLKNIAQGMTSLLIDGTSLEPAQRYKVQVRALLPKGGLTYTGGPSEWTEPQEWDSGSAWSRETLLYVGLCVLAALLCIALFFGVNTGRRKVLAWLESGPSPNKSKLFLQSKNFSCQPVIHEEEIMDVCRVNHLDSFSSCSSTEAKLDKKCEWQMSFSEDEGCLDCDRLPSPNSCDQMNCSATSALSFNGPYIICKGTPESPQVSVADQQEVKDKDVPSCIGSQLTAVLPEPMPPTVSHSRDDYVLLPNPGLSKSTEELVTHGNLNNNYHTTKVEGSERTGQGLKGEEQSPTVLLLGHNEGEPPSYTPMQFPIAPQGGTVQPSGYCFLPSTIPM
ncbi:cytokine receptor common subunit beta isoform X1 [Gadus morhua]|uniref:Fibronectin type-III domain-containing protein n=2 Tax=Gadus morhua TaxID=8049 RepID=A0A8C5BXR6_GADMO|nr:cytokine receptor common subunit beta-like isoform X1 [Gadus morhua]